MSAVEVEQLASPQRGLASSPAEAASENPFAASRRSPLAESSAMPQRLGAPEGGRSGTKAHERSSSAPDATLRIYFRSLGPFFVSFRAAYDRGDAAFRRSDPDDAALLATRLSAVSRDFSAPATAFRKVTAPASLRAAHLGMVTAIVLDARIFAIYADAWKGYAEDGDLQRAARRQAET